MSTFTQRDRDLKIATGDLVHALHGLEAAGSYIDRSSSTVQRWTSLDAQNEESFIPLRFVPELERRAPAPLITMALARMARGTFVRLPTVFADDDSLPLQVCALVDDLAGVSETVRTGQADGRFCAGDAAALERAADKLIEQAAAMKLYARVLQGKEVGK